MIKFDCEKCGKIEMALLDGYLVGDRLLEGVMFECRQNDDGTFVIQVEESSKPYFSNLNEKKWLEEVCKKAQKYDVFTCPTCGGDCVWDNSENS